MAEKRRGRPQITILYEWNVARARSHADQPSELISAGRLGEPFAVAAAAFIALGPAEPSLRSGHQALLSGSGPARAQGRRAPRVHVDGERLRIRKPRRALKPKLGDGARRVKIVWKGLRPRRKVKNTVVVPVTMVDERGKRFALKIRVPRG